MAQVYDPNYLALRYFGGFIPWVFKDIVLSRETDGNRLAGYRARREERRAVDADATGTFRRPAAASPTTRPRCG